MEWIDKNKELPVKTCDFTRITLKDDISEIRIMAEKGGYLMVRRKGAYPFVTYKKTLFQGRITHWKFT